MIRRGTSSSLAGRSDGGAGTGASTSPDMAQFPSRHVRQGRTAEAVAAPLSLNVEQISVFRQCLPGDPPVRAEVDLAGLDRPGPLREVRHPARLPGASPAPQCWVTGRRAREQPAQIAHARWRRGTTGVLPRCLEHVDAEPPQSAHARCDRLWWRSHWAARSACAPATGPDRPLPSAADGSAAPDAPTGSAPGGTETRSGTKQRRPPSRPLGAVRSSVRPHRAARTRRSDHRVGVSGACRTVAGAPPTYEIPEPRPGVRDDAVARLRPACRGGVRARPPGRGLPGAPAARRSAQCGRDAAASRRPPRRVQVGPRRPALVEPDVGAAVLPRRAGAGRLPRRRRSPPSVVPPPRRSGVAPTASSSRSTPARRRPTPSTRRSSTGEV